MPLFQYRAVAASGEVVEGGIEAPDRADALERLRSEGHLPLRLEQPAAGAGMGGARGFLRARRANQKDMVLLTREFATLLKAAVPLDRALGIVARVARSEVIRKTVLRVLEAVRGGASFADALRSEGDFFPRYYAPMVRAGEASGDLAGVLTRIAELMERSDALRENVRSALFYPALLLFMAGVSVVVLLTVVIPQLKPLFEEAGQALPLPTRILIAAGDAVQNYGWIMVAGIAVAVLLVRRQLQLPDWRRVYDRAVLRVPLLGSLVQRLETARFSRALAVLLGNGVPLLSALGIVSEILGNKAMADAVHDVAAHVREGRGLAEPLALTALFPDLAVQLVRVGEEVGQLEEMLTRVAEIFDDEVKRAVDRLLALLAPALTIGMGTLIALIIGSVLTAILGVNDLAF